MQISSFDFVENLLVDEDVYKKNRANSDKREFTNVPRTDCLWNTEQLHSLFYWAVQELDASDVELESDSPPYVKYYGRWNMACRRVLSDIDMKMALKDLSGNPSADSQVESGVPIDFRYQITVAPGVYRRFRCNATAKTLPDGRNVVSLVMRAIPYVLPTLKDVGLLPQEVKKYMPHRGLILISGPMGSGKTTTLAAIIRLRREAYPYESFGTYEDPVEFDYSACKGTGPLWQIELNSGLRDMRDVARNMARRSPNVILIGESRDPASFQAVIDGANMGCALYTTLHANSVADTISRIINVMPPERQLALMATLIDFSRYWVHQRLLTGTPDENGRPRRIPLRESLEFDETMKRELLLLSSVPLVMCRIHEFVNEYGRTLLQEATEKYEAGLLHEDSLIMIQEEFKDREKMIKMTKERVTNHG